MIDSVSPGGDPVIRPGITGALRRRGDSGRYSKAEGDKALLPGRIWKCRSARPCWPRGHTLANRLTQGTGSTPPEPLSRSSLGLSSVSREPAGQTGLKASTPWCHWPWSARIGSSATGRPADCRSRGRDHQSEGYGHQVHLRGMVRRTRQLPRAQAGRTRRGWVTPSSWRQCV